MPLRIVEITDLRDFTREFVNVKLLPNLDPHNQDLSEGINLGNSDGTTSGGEYTYGNYFHNADLYGWWQPNEKKDSGTLLRTVYGFFYATDALHRDTSRGWADTNTYQPTFGSATGRSYPFGATSKRRFIVGQPNLQTGEQLWYYWGDLSGSPTGAPEVYVAGWHSFHCATGARETFFANAWPNWSHPLNSLAAGAIDGNTAGYWHANSGVNGNQDEYHAIVFEGITDTTGGMPGETHASAGMIRGGTSHPLGLMLVRARESNFLGDGPSNDLGTRWLWIDIDTGLAVGILGQAGLANTRSNNTFHDESLDHKHFDWQKIQFVPDPGSTFAQPKGELHFFLSEDGRFELPGRTVEGPDGDFTSLTSRQYVKVVDFNPFNATTGGVRVHNRVRFLGILDTPCEPIQDGGVSLPRSGTTHNRRSPGCYYHPPSRTWCNSQSSFENANNAGTDEPAVGASRFMRWARQADVDEVTHPVVLESVRANSRMTVRTRLITDFGEPIAGETVHFRTNRQSTRDEQFNGTTQATSNYVVSQGVIDDDNSLEVYESAGIDDGGTLLTLGVDYTVSSYATGTLAPVGSWPTDTVSVRYRHRSSVVRPGYGTLINSSAVSDASGVATALIELDANLEGELIGLEVDSEVFA